MAFWNRKKTEARASVENPRVPISSEEILKFFGLDDVEAAGETVTIDKAMGIPAIWAAVNFLSGTMASLPLHLYKRTDSGREKVSSDLATIIHDAVSPEMTSFDWRKYTFERVFTGGRGLTFIERNTMGRVINLWPMNPMNTVVERRNGRKVYRYTENGRTVIYEASEVIDIPFTLEADGITARSPIMTNKDVIGLGIASTKYGGKFFNGGGVPPFAVTGNFTSGAGLKRGAADLNQAVREAAREKRLALTLPTGHEIKPIGTDPEKSQLVETRKFQVEEYARIYSLPPNFLQDLSNGTFNNTEQQDLHLVKHTLKRWVVQMEQEMNLKLFGQRNSAQYVEFDLDGLLRGDFKTRMEGYALGIQNAILTPNEARRKENRPDEPEGNQLLIQGATVPLGSQPQPGENNGP